MKRQGRHRVFNWHILVVWVMPYRRKGFDFCALDALRAICEHGGAVFESMLWAMDGADGSCFASWSGGVPLAVVKPSIEIPWTPT